MYALAIYCDSDWGREAYPPNGMRLSTQSNLAELAESVSDFIESSSEDYIDIEIDDQSEQSVIRALDTVCQREGLVWGLFHHDRGYLTKE